MSEVTKDLGQHDVSSFGTSIDGTETTQEQADALVEQYAQMFAHGARTPVLKRPSDIGLDYEEAFFPSLDGVPLEVWFIPADSDSC